LWNGWWWVDVRFCSSRCAALYELKQQDTNARRWRTVPRPPQILGADLAATEVTDLFASPLEPNAALQQQQLQPKQRQRGAMGKLEKIVSDFALFSGVVAFVFAIVLAAATLLT